MTRRIFALAGLWSVLAFALNLLWEIAQVRLYTIWAAADRMSTAWSEWFNVYRVGSWGYIASMPLIFGIGLAPLLQWLILPPLMVAAHRKLRSPLFSATPDAQHDFTRSRP